MPIETLPSDALVTMPLAALRSHLSELEASLRDPVAAALVASRLEEAQAWHESARVWAIAADLETDEHQIVDRALRATRAFVQAECWYEAATWCSIAHALEDSEAIVARSHARGIGALHPGLLFERAEAWDEGGDWYRHQHRWPDALRCYVRAKSWANCGEAAVALRWWRDAAAYYLRAGANVAAADCFERLGDWEQVGYCLEAAAHEHPEAAWQHENLQDAARAYLKAGANPEVRRCLDLLDRDDQELEPPTGPELATAGGSIELACERLVTRR